MKTATVTTRFRDAYDHGKTYVPGDTVVFDDDRIESLVRRGLVKVEQPAASGITSTHSEPNPNPEEAVTASEGLGFDTVPEPNADAEAKPAPRRRGRKTAQTE